MEIIGNGGVPFLQSGQLVMNVHGLGSKMRGEHSLKGGPDLEGGGAFDDVGENVF